MLGSCDLADLLVQVTEEMAAVVVLAGNLGPEARSIQVVEGVQGKIEDQDQDQDQNLLEDQIHDHNDEVEADSCQSVVVEDSLEDGTAMDRVDLEDLEDLEADPAAMHSVGAVESVFNQTSRAEFDGLSAMRLCQKEGNGNIHMAFAHSEQVCD